MPSNEARESVEGMCMMFHQSVRTLASDFLMQLQRHYYATPTSYLELISTYKTLLAAKRTQVYTLKHRSATQPQVTNLSPALSPLVHHSRRSLPEDHKGSTAHLIGYLIPTRICLTLSTSKVQLQSCC